MPLNVLPHQAELLESRILLSVNAPPVESVAVWRAVDGALLQATSAAGTEQLSLQGVSASAAWQPLAVGDFDGDASTDWLGVADDGRFRLRARTPLGVTEVDWGPAFAAGQELLGQVDLNGDGLLDLIAADRAAHELWVSVNSHHGFRSERWGVLPRSFEQTFVGDFNGDTRPDLLFGQPGDQWTLAENRLGSISLTDWGSYPLFDWQTVVSGDFDGNGIQDVAARARDNTWWVWRGTDSGLQTADYWGHWKMRSAWHEIDVGDFDADGRDDIIGRSEDGHLWVGTSTGDAFHTWTWGTGWVHSAQWSHVQVLDMDQDGLPDRLGAAQDGTWWFAHNTGTGFENHFWLRATTDEVTIVQEDVLASPIWRASAAESTAATQNPRVLPPAAISRGDTIAVSVWAPTADTATQLTVWADFDQDGTLATPEIVWAGTLEAGWNEIPWSTPHNAELGEIQVRFRLSASVPQDADFWVNVLPAEADVMVEYDEGLGWTVQRNKGDSFSAQAWPELYRRETWTPIAQGDFSGDGATDVLGIQDSGRYWLLKNGGSQFEGAPWGGTLNTVDWTYRQAADFDSDGDLDLMAFESKGGTWWLTLNTGDSSRNEFWGRSGVANWQDFFPGDFNNDGRPDVLLRERSGQLRLAQNTGDGLTTRLLPTSIDPAVWQHLFVGDFNGDGWLDLVGRDSAGAWSLWAGNGNGWSDPLLWSDRVGNGAFPDILVADMDDDGVDDVMARDARGTWWLMAGGASGFRSRAWGYWDPQIEWTEVASGRFDSDHLPDLIGRANGEQWWVGRNTGAGLQPQYYGPASVAAEYVFVGQDFVEPPRLESGIPASDVEQRSYGDYAREVLGNLMEFGTDRYGDEMSARLMNVIDVRSRVAPEAPLPLDSADRVIRPGRRGPGGSNLYMDQPTLRAFERLADQTGDARYRQFVEDNLQLGASLTDENGLFWWGWHRFYDAYADQPSGNRGNFHEIQIQQAMWEQLWQADPEAVTAEIEAIWEHHIVDHETGENNRHHEATSPPLAFAHSGGDFVYAFAFLSTKTNDPVWLERAKLVANYYWQSRDPLTNLVPYIPNAGERSESSRTHTGVVGMYARSLLLTYQLTGDPQFRDQALGILTAYDQYAYDPEAMNYWASVALDGTPIPGPRLLVDSVEQYEPRGYIDLWQPYVAGAEFPLATAQTYALAYELTGDDTMLRAARRWSDLLMASFPADQSETHAWYQSYSRYWAEDGTYAETYGRLISFSLHLQQLTGEVAHFEFAKTVANEAISKLYYEGLFRGHHAKPYYESVDGVGYLLVALLQLEDAARGNLADAANY